MNNMKSYDIKGRVKASLSNPDAITREFTELAGRSTSIQPSLYYRNELSRLSLKVYEPEPFYLEKPSKEQISNELREIAEHKYYRLFGSDKARIEQYISENIAVVLEQREKAWNEIKEFFDAVESEKEKVENRRLQKEYEKEFKKKHDYITGETEYVAASIDRTFINLKLPFDALVTFDYDKEKQLARLDVEIPSNINIPTVKTNVSATYSRTSVKNKLVREMDDEKSRTIIGFGYYLCSLVMSSSANIENIELTIRENETKCGVMWAYVPRENFSSPKQFNPLVDIYKWNHIANIKLVRGGTHIEPTDNETFTKQINNKRLLFGIQ